MVMKNGESEVKYFILLLIEKPKKRFFVFLDIVKWREWGEVFYFIFGGIGKKEWKKESDLRERTTIFIAFGPKCPWYVEIMQECTDE